MAKILVGTQPLTIARGRNGAHVYVYKGTGIAAESLDPDDAARLLQAGFLKEAPVEPSSDDADADGSVKGVLAEVGEDKEKAQAALDAEKAKDKPRTSLVTKLEAILAAGA